MKAKKDSSRPARFLSVLLVMVLVVSCTALTAALGEGGTNPTDVTYSLLIYGLEPDMKSEFTFSLNFLCSGFVTEIPVSLPEEERTNQHHYLAYVLEEGGKDFLLLKDNCDTLFIVDGCYVDPQEDHEKQIADWASIIASHVYSGSDVYIYITSSNPETEHAINTQEVVDYLLETHKPGNPDGIMLEKNEENLYVATGAENSGTLQVLYLDNLEEYPASSLFYPWEFVFNKFVEHLGLDEDVFTLQELYVTLQQVIINLPKNT